MLIIKQQRNLFRNTTLKQKYIQQLPDGQRRASCYCDQCGKLTHLQSIFFNTPLTVQQHQRSDQSTSIEIKQQRKQISISFHLQNPSNMVKEKRIKRRKSCNCNLCGNETNFQITTNYKIPQTKRIHQHLFKSFVIKQQLGRVFKVISDNKRYDQQTVSSLSNRDAIMKFSCKSPLLIKHEMSRKGRAIQQLYQSQGFQQKFDLRKQKTEKSPPQDYLVQPSTKLSKFSKTSNKVLPLIRFRSTWN